METLIYFHAVDKEGAKSLLQDQPDGTFLLRPMEGQSEQYILSVVFKGKDTHHLVARAGDGWRVNGKIFGEPNQASIADVVQTLGTPQTGWPVALSNPILKTIIPFAVLTKHDAEETLRKAGLNDGRALFRQRTEGNYNDLILSVVFKGKPTHHLVKRDASNDPYTVNGKSLGEAATSIQQVAVELMSPKPFWPVPLIYMHEPELQHEMTAQQPSSTEVPSAVNSTSAAPDTDHVGDSDAQVSATEIEVSDSPAASAADSSDENASHRSGTTSSPSSSGPSSLSSRESSRPPSPVTKLGDVDAIDPQADTINAMTASAEGGAVVPLDTGPADTPGHSADTESTSPEPPSIAMTSPPMDPTLRDSQEQMSQYHHGAIDKDEANSRLEAAGLDDGRFLLRQWGADPESCIVSVVFRGKPTHHLVEKTGEKFTVNKKQLQAGSLLEVVSELGRKHSFWPVPLDKPVPPPREKSDSQSTAQIVAPAGGPGTVYPEMGKAQADEKLNAIGGSGTFLLWKMPGPADSLVLSVVYKGKPTHHRLEKQGKLPYTINGKDTASNGLEGVISFLRESHPFWPVPLVQQVQHPFDAVCILKEQDQQAATPMMNKLVKPERLTSTSPVPSSSPGDTQPDTADKSLPAPLAALASAAAVVEEPKSRQKKKGKGGATLVDKALKRANKLGEVPVVSTLPKADAKEISNDFRLKRALAESQLIVPSALNGNTSLILLPNVPEDNLLRDATTVSPDALERQEQFNAALHIVSRWESEHDLRWHGEKPIVPPSLLPSIKPASIIAAEYNIERPLMPDRERPLEETSFYFGNMTAAAAEAKLMEPPAIDGLYLVRRNPRGDGRTYFLSALLGGQVHHIRLQLVAVSKANSVHTGFASGDVSLHSIPLVESQLQPHVFYVDGARTDATSIHDVISSLNNAPGPIAQLPDHYLESPCVAPAEEGRIEQRAEHTDLVAAWHQKEADKAQQRDRLLGPYNAAVVHRLRQATKRLFENQPPLSRFVSSQTLSSALQPSVTHTAQLMTYVSRIELARKQDERTVVQRRASTAAVEDLFKPVRFQRSKTTTLNVVPSGAPPPSLPERPSRLQVDGPGEGGAGGAATNDKTPNPADEAPIAGSNSSTLPEVQLLSVAERKQPFVLKQARCRVQSLMSSNTVP